MKRYNPKFRNLPPAPKLPPHRNPMFGNISPSVGVRPNQYIITEVEIIGVAAREDRIFTIGATDPSQTDVWFILKAAYGEERTKTEGVYPKRPQSAWDCGTQGKATETLGSLLRQAGVTETRPLRGGMDVGDVPERVKRTKYVHHMGHQFLAYNGEQVLDVEQHRPARINWATALQSGMASHSNTWKAVPENRSAIPAFIKPLSTIRKLLKKEAANL